MTASSQAVHSVAARDRRPTLGVLHHPRVRLEQTRNRRGAVGRQPVRTGQAREVAEPGPGLGEEPAGAPVQPVKLQPPGRGHAEHEHPADPLRMPLRVRQRQRHPPRPAAQQPLAHAEVLAQLLHVPEQVLGRVQAHVSRGVAGVRQAAAAVALVEEDDPELLRVKRPPASRRAPRPRAAVHDQRWHAIGVPAGLPVHEVPVTGVQQAGLIGLDIRIPRHAEDLIGPVRATGRRHAPPKNRTGHRACGWPSPRRGRVVTELARPAPQQRDALRRWRRCMSQMATGRQCRIVVCQTTAVARQTGGARLRGPGCSAT